MKLEGKVALVTGAARGIGRSIALLFAKEGARLILDDILEDKVHEVAEEIRGLGREALPIKADVSHSDQVAFMVSKAMERFNRIDVLVNNAGVSETGPAEDFTEHSWDNVLGTDLKGVFLCSQVVGREMIKKRQGSIVNISSIAGFDALPGRVGYCSAKSAVIMLTKVLAIEWAKHNIRVNAVAPGYVRTRMIEEMMELGILDEKKITQRTPMQRICHPDEIARIVLMLSSEESSYITGATISVDGGWVAYGYI
jgi:NAD(P)-dependent dehydrogenase (short-subunit alcohol dehydrogenase family)